MLRPVAQQLLKNVSLCIFVYWLRFDVIADQIRKFGKDRFLVFDWGARLVTLLIFPQGKKRDLTFRCGF
jgi:hypothetical protein